VAGEDAFDEEWRARQAKGADWFRVGKEFLDESRWEEASLALQQSVASDPTHAEAWAGLGAAERNLGHLQNALLAYEHSLALLPDQASVIVAGASILSELGQADRAIAILRAFLGRDAKCAAAWNALGDALRLAARGEEAVEAYLTAQSLGPVDFEIFYGLAKLRLFQYALPEAESVLRAIASDEAKTADAWTLLGEVLRAQGRVDEAAAAMRRSLELNPRAENHSKLLMTRQYFDDVTPELLLGEHRQWDADYAAPLAPPPYAAHSRQGGVPLRIGFYSANFKRHPVGYLTLRAIECLDKNECSVICYSDFDGADDFTSRYRAASTAWRLTKAFTAEQLAERIKHDKLDVLVDLEGHTADRMMTFARKPAPVQMTWAGYVGTTGLAAMDYLLADRFHVAPGEETNYVEVVLRMPHGYICYTPPQSPPVNPLPALQSGQFTFACFNHPAKCSPRIIEAWARILHRVPTAVLLFKYMGLQHAQVQDSLRVQFAQHHIDVRRILIEHDTEQIELMETYNRVDLALDTQPYSGGVTTCEALWMGVPVITFPGRTFAGRHATSHLMNAGYRQFVAVDIEGYVELAVLWANRLDELAEIRANMREQVRRSPLCDAEQFAKDFLRVLQQACEARVET
jgi:protein O-GlcNAc transferase